MQGGCNYAQFKEAFYIGPEHISAKKKPKITVNWALIK